jgi:hypothetical protein
VNKAHEAGDRARTRRAREASDSVVQAAEEERHGGAEEGRDERGGDGGGAGRGARRGLVGGHRDPREGGDSDGGDHDGAKGLGRHLATVNVCRLCSVHGGQQESERGGVVLVCVTEMNGACYL